MVKTEVKNSVSNQIDTIKTSEDIQDTINGPSTYQDVNEESVQAVRRSQ